jgi:hypothetical protein
MQQISADVFPFANGAKNARYYRATALRVGVCLPAGCFRSRFRFLEAAVMPRRAIAQQCYPHPATRQVKWGCRPGDVGGDDVIFQRKLRSAASSAEVFPATLTSSRGRRLGAKGGGNETPKNISTQI